MFNYFQPTRIHFGLGALENLAKMSERYGKKCLLVTTPNVVPLDKLFNRVKKILGESNIEVVHFDKVLPNPTCDVVEEGLVLANENKVDFVLSVGGGSSMDTAKIIALNYGLHDIDWDALFATGSNPFIQHEVVSQKKLPLILVPTTSGTGSQVTQAAVISRGVEKETIFHQDNFADECIIDPELMKTLPSRITASTGFDAFTHAFESYISKKASVMTEIQGLKAMELVIENLPKALADGLNSEYREKLAIADTFAGSSLANAGAAAPHPLGEIIGGLTHISHGETLAIVFPAFIKSSSAANEAKFAHVARLFNKELEKADDKKASEALYDEIVGFLQTLGLNKNLRDFGVTEAQLEEILEHPVLGYLPFAKKEDLQEILRESF